MTDDLAALRRDLDDERTLMLMSLKAARDALRAERQANAADRGQPLIAFEIMITILERENFLRMSVERMPVVLCQVENRLRRLGRFINRLNTELQAIAAQHALAPANG